MLEIEDGAAFTAIGIMSSAAAHTWRRVEWIPELSAIRRERKPPGHPGAVEKQDPDTANARVANSTRNSCIAASEVCFDQDKAQAGKDCNAKKKKGSWQEGEPWFARLSFQVGRFSIHANQTKTCAHALSCFHQLKVLRRAPRGRKEWTE